MAVFTTPKLAVIRCGGFESGLSADGNTMFTSSGKVHATYVLPSYHVKKLIHYHFLDPAIMINLIPTTLCPYTITWYRYKLHLQWKEQNLQDILGILGEPEGSVLIAET